ncbi:hypothetical protein ABIC45_002620 [Mucilaginibacter rubeus]|uniref:Qat anti-phage system QueC-like protein QatC n=1 Tax=Mucilaginibacter rubeus TaxID=2027860 RepID=UPI00339B8DD4
MRVNVHIDRPRTLGEFAVIGLSFAMPNNTVKRAALEINFQELMDFTADTSSVAFDFFLVSSLIYGIDNLLEREQYSIDGWTREIEIAMPVRNIESWQNIDGEFSTIATFLTGDFWKITFEPIADDFVFFENRANRRTSNIPVFDYSIYSFASLFSGGLDSLVGILDELSVLGPDQKGLLLSHFDSSSPGASRDQHEIINFLSHDNELRTTYTWLQTIVYLRNRDSLGVKIRKEASYRSRSLLFIGIALMCIEKLPNCNTLIIPENGTISLNFPLTPSRSSTLSTRTTHPHYIEELQLLIGKLGIETRLHNPYQSKTKGQLVEGCLNYTKLAVTYQMSVSCGKRGRKMHWDTKSGTHHCGICMPCIYRRAALHKIGLDNQLYGIDVFSTNPHSFNKYDFPALFDFLNNAFDTEKIKRTLITSGAIKFDQLDDSARLVENVKEEIKQWIRDKGNDHLKLLAGAAD